MNIKSAALSFTGTINLPQLNRISISKIPSGNDNFVLSSPLAFQGNIRGSELVDTVKNNSSSVIFIPGKDKAQISFQGRNVTDKNILVTGGAGYIGSHTAKHLLEKGYNVVIIDNLDLGNKGAVDQLRKIADKNGQKVKFYQTDIANTDKIADILNKNKIDAVVHFAAYSQVAESVKDPLKYYINNTAKTAILLNEMIKAGVNKIVFSSTAATYGDPDEKNIPIREDSPQNPINPYGTSKLMIEKIMDDAKKAHGMESIRLRYFNVAGASTDGELGEVHNPETHLIPNILKPALAKKKGEGEVQEFKLFGTDYPTRDGTCIRDYIHVEDLANAHELALQKLFNGGETSFYNLGSGEGSTVKEVFNTCEEVTGVKIPVKEEERREGDPPVLLASNKKAQQELGWKPEKTLKDMVESTWNWIQNPKF